MRRTLLVGLAYLCAARAAAAQGSVPITSEPHHHLVYSDNLMRVFRVAVPAHAETLIHEHPVDYLWVAVGPGDFVNAVVGKPEANVTAADGSVHFTRGGFAHLARVNGAQGFRNVTIELPGEQTNPRNLCELVLPDQPLDCDAARKRAAAQFPGSAVEPEFETDQLRVSLVSLAPGTRLALARHKRAPFLVAADDAAGPLPITCPVAGRPRRLPLQARYGNTYRLTGTAPCGIRNDTRARVRFLVLEFAPPPR